MNSVSTPSTDDFQDDKATAERAAAAIRIIAAALAVAGLTAITR